MFKKFAIAFFAFISFNAAAAPFIDFEGVGNGAQVLDFYNGGTDSQGNSGVNYGIRFTGGTVQYNAFGAYLSGSTVMSFNNNIVGDGISLWANGMTDDSMSYLLVDGNRVEAQMIPDYQWNPRGTSHSPYLETSLFSSVIRHGGDSMINGVFFQTRSIDNLTFGTNVAMLNGAPTNLTFIRNSLPATGGVSNGEVPLPGTAWLVAIGAMAFLGRRKAMQ